MSSENYEQIDDSNHPIHKLEFDVSSDHEEPNLNPQDVKDNAGDREGDDFSEEINNDDVGDDGDGSDYDNYESMLEEVDDDNDDDDHHKPSPLFEGDYRCFPLWFIDKGDLDVGNKIILPAKDLAPIIEKQIHMPLQFEIHNLSKGKVSHCGVYEFSGHENGVVFMPDWMMENMQLEEGDFVYMKNTNLGKGTYIKLQPHSSDFLEISDPKAVLEENLQKFSCLTKGDTIVIIDGSKKYRINLVETKPGNAISVVDTDIEVDFTAPLDYKEPVNHTVPTKQQSTSSVQSSLKEEATEKPEFKPFTGVARKLGEEPSSEDLGYLPLLYASAAQRRIKAAEAKATTASESQPRRKRKELTGENVEAEKKKKFQPFTGKKYTLNG